MNEKVVVVGGGRHRRNNRGIAIRERIYLFEWAQVILVVENSEQGIRG